MLAATVSGASVSVVVVVVVVLPAVAPFLYAWVSVCVGVLFGEFVRSFQSLGGVVLAREPVLSLSRSFVFSLSHPRDGSNIDEPAVLELRRWSLFYAFPHGWSCLPSTGAKEVVSRLPIPASGSR